MSVVRMSGWEAVLYQSVTRKAKARCGRRLERASGRGGQFECSSCLPVPPSV